MIATAHLTDHVRSLLGSNHTDEYIRFAADRAALSGLDTTCTIAELDEATRPNGEVIYEWLTELLQVGIDLHAQFPHVFTVVPEEPADELTDVIELDDGRLLAYDWAEVESEVHGEGIEYVDDYQVRIGC